MRVDPLSGSSGLLAKFAAISPGSESMAFDPYRQGLILMARLHPADGILWQPYLVDGTGQFQALDPPIAAWNGFAPTGDGRIDFRDTLTSAQPFEWLDAANQIHVLYEADGVTPFSMDGDSSWLEDMIYVASEGALITVTSAPNTPCPGGIASRLHVRKRSLSADGARVSGPMLCAEFSVTTVFEDGETSHGFSLMSDGDLSNAVGGATAALFVGLAKSAVPFYGGTFHVGALQLAVPFAVGETGGVAGAGSLALPATLPAIPALSGASIFLQAAFADATAVFGVSLTQGLELEIG